MTTASQAGAIPKLREMVLSLGEHRRAGTTNGQEFMTLLEQIESALVPIENQLVSIESALVPIENQLVSNTNALRGVAVSLRQVATELEEIEERIVHCANAKEQ